MDTSKFFLELKSHNFSHLEKRVGVSRQALHNAVKTKNMKLENLSSLARALHYQVELHPSLSEENLLASLARWGAPLAHSKDGNLSLEAALGESLAKARKDGLYESVVPYVLAVQAERLNPLLLAGVAYQNNQVNVLGYFAEMANHFRPHPQLQKLLNLLQAAKNEVKESLVLPTKINFPELFEKNQFALKWNLWVRGSALDHFSRWEKWEQSRKKN